LGLIFTSPGHMALCNLGALMVSFNQKSKSVSRAGYAVLLGHTGQVTDW